MVPLEINPIMQGIWTPDGRVQGDVELTLDSDDVERMRLGYVCAKCLEVFEQAWPERCPLCGVSVRRDQAAYFAREFAGERRLGPSTTLADEQERLQEQLRRNNVDS